MIRLIHVLPRKIRNRSVFPPPVRSTPPTANTTYTVTVIHCQLPFVIPLTYTPEENLKMSSPPSESEIRSLLASARRYSPSSAPQLESYVKAMSSNDAPYLFDAIRILIKLYQQHPSIAKSDVMAAGFMLALTQYPSTDLLALSYLIPPAVLAAEPCASIQAAADQLQACQFATFWETCQNTPALQTLLSAGARRRLQTAILSVLACTYKEAPTALVLQALQASSTKDLEGEAAVESANDTSVVFVSTADNTKRQRVYQKGVNFSTISSLLTEIAQ